jgi:hypothetical protein
MKYMGHIEGNLGLTNLKGPKILFFIAGVLLLVGFFIINLTTEGLEIMFFITGILLLRGSLYQGSSVLFICNILLAMT